jgi:hypothetical protein
MKNNIHIHTQKATIDGAPGAPDWSTRTFMVEQHSRTNSVSSEPLSASNRVATAERCWMLDDRTKQIQTNARCSCRSEAKVNIQQQLASRGRV